LPAALVLTPTDAVTPPSDVKKRWVFSPKDFAKLEIDLPPLDEQWRIAAFVSDAQAAYRTAIEAAEIRRVLARRLVDARLFGDNQKN
jgi:hypothetical protein